MNTDAYFEIGSSHKVCQDYAIHGRVGDWAYVIGSDGCSSSPMTDVGARILALRAKNAVKLLHSLSGNHLTKSEETERFIRKIISLSIRRTYADFSIATEVLDATLWVLISDGSDTLVIGWGDGSLGWGDGSLVIRYPEQEPIIISNHYLSGAPYYLTYGVDESRRKRYHEEFNQHRVVEQDGETLEAFSPDVPLIHPVMDPNWLSVTICSDGIGTYMDSNNESVPVKDIAQEWTRYKNPVGQFVQRRMQTLKKRCLREGLRHTDDIFCGTIIRRHG